MAPSTPDIAPNAPRTERQENGTPFGLMFHQSRCTSALLTSFDHPENSPMNTRITPKP